MLKCNLLSYWIKSHKNGIDSSTVINLVCEEWHNDVKFWRNWLIKRYWVWNICFKRKCLSISNQWQDTRMLINLCHKMLWKKECNLYFHTPGLVIASSRPWFMCTYMGIEERRNQMVVTCYPPVSCIGICHIWKSLFLHLWGNFSLNLGLWEFLYLNHLWVAYAFLYLGLSTIGVRENLGDFGRHFATGVILFEPLILG